METHAVRQEEEENWHLFHAVLYIRLRGTCRAYLFPSVNGRSWSGGSGADCGAGCCAGWADWVNLAGNIVDFTSQDGQVLSQVLADPAHTGE